MSACSDQTGAGKSTLLRHAGGLRAPDGGGRCSEWTGRAASYRPIEIARRRGFLPQTIADAFSLTVMEAVMSARHPSLPFCFKTTPADPTKNSWAFNLWANTRQITYCTGHHKLFSQWSRLLQMS